MLVIVSVEDNFWGIILYSISYLVKITGLKSPEIYEGCLEYWWKVKINFVFYKS